jgi:putative Holliday junction resolvase
MRILGLDYGSKTVGVALTDELLITAAPFETIVRKEENKLRRTLARIEAIIEEKGVTEIVLGNPVHMDGSPSERSILTAAFKEKLERRTGLPVALMDERLTTVEADEVLKESGIPKEDRKQYVDQVAASLILKAYLEQRKKER